MAITELLFLISSITCHDTTGLPSKERIETRVSAKSDSLMRGGSNKPLDSIKSKVEKSPLLRTIRRGGWDRN
jgi:hypothetical protein